MKKADHKFFFHVAVFVILTTVLISCGSRRTFETQAPVHQFGRYEIVEIPDFGSDIPNSPPDLQLQIPNQLAKKLRKELTFTGVVRSPVAASSGVMIIDGTIIDIQPPEWYKQLVRTTSIVIKIRFTDKESGTLIAESSFEGTSKFGLISGSVLLGASGRATDEIISYLKSNYVRRSIR